jgi:hypothetical protein
MTWQFAEAGRTGAALPRLIHASGSGPMAAKIQCEGETT